MPHLNPQSASGRGDVAAALGDAHAARFRSARDRLTKQLERGRLGADGMLLLIRLVLRDDVPAALALLTSHAASFRTDRDRGLAAIYHGIAQARLGDRDSARAAFERAEPLVRRAPDLVAELLYERASAAWIERKLPAARALIERLPPSLAPDLALRVAILRGLIASAGEDLATQGAVLLAARSGAADAGMLARGILASQLATLAAELPGQALRDAATVDVDAVEWTDELAAYRFDALRFLAWRHALDGDHFGAFRRLKAAVAVAPSAAWRVAALADRSYLAGALGERRWAAQERRDAHDLAATVDWRATDGEEKLALPQLAELFAADDPALALQYVSTFSALREAFSRTLSSRRDARVTALVAYSLGCVQAALGDRAEAERLLREAVDVYDRLGIVWRAARGRLKLADLGATAERERAIEALRVYPRSWLTGSAHAADRAVARVREEPAEVARLTVAQRRVYDLLIEGRGTKEISESLGRSSFTVRNHIKAIFQAFGVTSRPALLAKAARSD